MAPSNPQRGLTLIEVLVASAVLMLVGAGLFSFLVNNSRLNKAQRMRVQVQTNARATLSLVTQKLRSAGWDPLLSGLTPVALDPNTADAISQIEVFADIDMDGKTITPMEQLLIRHNRNAIEWRTTGDTTQAFDTVAVGISNDADGDGTPEPMFVPDSTTAPTRITVRITAEANAPDPRTGQVFRYTVSNVVALRKSL